jgi:hypothetical protein
MNRILRGAVVFAASALVWACNTEPDVVGGGDPVDIVADPGVILVPQFSSEEVLVRVVDAQGQSLESEITIANVGAGITVTADPLYRPIYGPDGSLTANTANSEIRLELDGEALGSTSFTVTGSGLSRDVTVTVVPSDLDAAFAPAVPLAGDTVTLTLPAGLRLAAGFTFTSARGDNPIFIDVAADSLSARVILAPNATTPDVLANQVVTIFNPSAGAFVGLPLRNLPPVATASLYAGASACATAPTLISGSRLWDLPPTDATSRYYAFTVPGPAGTQATIFRQPSPSNSATRLEILDAGTCTLVPPVVAGDVVTPTKTTITNITYVDTLVDGPRTIRFRRDSTIVVDTEGDSTVTIFRDFLAPGDYVARIMTGPFTLPNGDEAPPVEAIRVEYTVP